MVHAGEFHRLIVLRSTEFGLYLDNGGDGILLPNRFLPENIKAGDSLDVFVYHDSEDRLIATTQKPLGSVNDIVKLTCESVTQQGAFLNWGLMKDLFVPKSQQVNQMRPKGEYLVKIYRDEKTGRTAATERFENDLSNDHLTVKQGDEVKMTVLRRTDIGYLVIINNLHTGVLHFNEVYRTIGAGDKFHGFIKNILPENKIDVAAGKMGYERVEDESAKVLRLLDEHNGYLPYHDKSDPEEIYLFFGMSKKTFKMTTGKLFKDRKISFEKTGIKKV